MPTASGAPPRKESADGNGFVTKRTSSPLCSNVSNRVFPQAAKFYIEDRNGACRGPGQPSRRTWGLLSIGPLQPTKGFVGFSQFQVPEHAFPRFRPSLKCVGIGASRLPGPAESREAQAEHHELRPDLVETDVRNAGFEIISREDHFIERPADGHIWWLLVAALRHPR